MSQQYGQGEGGYPPPPSQGPPTGPPGVAPQTAVYAHWWKRVVAALIDGAILYVVNLIIVAITGGVFAADPVQIDPTTGEVTGGRGFFAALILGNLIMLIIGIVYYVWLNGNERGQTVGKMALKLQVRTENELGPIGYGKAAVRYLVGAVLFLLCIIPGVVDLLFPLWDDKRQTLHDKAASTVVVDLNP